MAIGDPRTFYPTVFAALPPLMLKDPGTSGILQRAFAFYERQNRRLTLKTFFDSAIEHLI